jgi:hypothetical protein
VRLAVRDKSRVFPQPARVVGITALWAAGAVLPARWSLPTPIRQGAGPVDRLPWARAIVDSSRHVIIIELPPTDLPATQPRQDVAMVLLPIYQVELPTAGSIYRAHIDVLDSAGNPLPRELLHHLNLSDPERRELFLPIGLHVMAAGRETPPLEVPRFLFGLPLRRGQRFLTSAMLVNPTSHAYSKVRVRLVLNFEPADALWPLFPGYPWVLDVLFPLGHPPDGSKSFDLPPGRSVHSWESSPAIPGTIVGVGGHLHNYGVKLELSDATTGEVIWETAPVTDSAGHVVSVPTCMLYNWHRLGVHIVPAHRYRVTAVYDNPTGHVIPDGGMGLVAGLFVPDRGTHWPAVDTSDTLYQQDLQATLQADEGGARAMMRMDRMTH